MNTSIDTDKTQNHPELSPETLLIDIKPIEASAGHPIQCEADIIEHIEVPVRTATTDLFRKNIKTVSSSANNKDIQTGRAYITIDPSQLSEENREIANRMIAMNNSKDETDVIHSPSLIDDPFTLFGHIQIVVPLSEKSTVGEIEDGFAEITSAFTFQKPESHTLDGWAKEFGVSAISADTLVQRYGFYFDPESGYFYESEEIFHHKPSEAFSETIG